MLKEFCTSTPAHGYDHLTKGSKVNKICWSIVLVTALFATVGHLYVLTSSYLKYDYYEVITVKPDIERTFLDVAICDTVRISDYALSKYEGSFLFYYNSITAALYRQSIKNTLYSEEAFRSLLKNTVNPAFMLANIETDQRMNIGTQFESLVVDCIFKEKKCDENNFELHISPDY